MPRANDELDASGVSVRNMSAEEIDGMLNELSVSTAQLDAETASPTPQAPAEAPPDTEAAARTPTAEPEPGTDAAAETDPFTPGAIEEALAQAGQTMRELETAVGITETADADAPAEDAPQPDAQPASKEPEAPTQAAVSVESPAVVDEATRAESSEAPPATPSVEGRPDPQQTTPSNDLEPGAPTDATPAEPEGGLATEREEPVPDSQSPAGQAAEAAESPPAAVEQGEATASAQAAEVAPSAESAAAPVGPVVRSPLVWRLARAPAVVAVQTAVVLDMPFAGIGPATKAILGYVGLATLLVALATWVLGGFMRPA